MIVVFLIALRKALWATVGAVFGVCRLLGTARCPLCQRASRPFWDVLRTLLTNRGTAMGKTFPGYLGCLSNSRIYIDFSCGSYAEGLL